MTDWRFSEDESLTTYIDTVASSMEAILPMLIARYGLNDRSVQLTREAAAKIREVAAHMGAHSAAIRKNDGRCGGRNQAKGLKQAAIAASRDFRHSLRGAEPTV